MPSESKILLIFHRNHPNTYIEFIVLLNTERRAMKAKALLLLTIACLLAMAQSKSRPLIQPKKTNDNKANRKLLSGVGLGIYVLDEQGDKHYVELKPDATVADLRAARRISLDCRLTFAGKKLDEGAVLADIGVTAESTVDVVRTEIISEKKPYDEQPGDRWWLKFIDSRNTSGKDEHIAVEIRGCAADNTLADIITHVASVHGELAEAKTLYERVGLSARRDRWAFADEQKNMNSYAYGSVFQVYYGDPSDAEK